MRGQKEQMQGEIDELKLKCLKLEGQLISAAKEEDRLHQENMIVKSQLQRGFIQ
jgi:FtsZ-binding cell division protein ZapB